MSHFSVMVIVPPCEPEEVEEKVTAMLAPYHEFECTGVDDEYVVDVEEDIEKERQTYLDHTTTLIRCPDGTLTSPFEGGNYKPMFVRETGDGPFKDREMFVPEGYEQVEVPTKTVEDFVTWLHGWNGRQVMLEDGTVVMPSDDDGQYGRIVVRRREQRRAVNISDDQSSTEVLGDYEVVKLIDRTNPSAKWDWWVIGGRWSGHFNRGGTEGNPNVPASLQSLTQSGNIIRKGDWAFEERLKAAAERYGGYYDIIAAVLAEHPNTLTWEQMRERHPDSIDDARNAYHDQPGVKAAKEAKRPDATPEELADDWDRGTIIGRFGDGVDDYRVSRDQFITARSWLSVGTFAMLDEQGWHEKGSMGWFGCVSDEDDNWAAKALERLRAVPDDHWLVCVDAHI